jgi:hypothetical protein
MPGLSEVQEEVDHDEASPPGGASSDPPNDFVQQWTKIVLVLAVTLATLNGVAVGPVL